MNARYAAIKKNSIIAAVGNTLLGIIKIIAGYVGNSHGLIADGFHSLSDLITDFLVLVASRFGSQSPDVGHPYGHGRFETMATMFLAIILILVGAGIVYDGIQHVMAGNLVKPDSMVLWVIILSILAKEAMYQYTRIVAIKIKSELLRANAWHHRTDAASSIVVLIGVIGALMGVFYLDAIAAAIVGLMIIHVGWSLGWSSIQELVDTAVDEQTLECIKEIISAVSGVQMIHQLRTRSMHGNILVDVHILVDPKLSVSEGHFIAQQVHYTLMKQVDSIVDVTVHIDPENDEEAPTSFDLPSRQKLMPMLVACWQDLPHAVSIQDVILHYLNGKVNVQICMPVSAIKKPEDLAVLSSAYSKVLNGISKIGEVEIILRVELV